MVGTSFVSYQPFLFERDLVPLPVLTLAILILIVLLGRDIFRQLYSSTSPADTRDLGATSGPAAEAFEAGSLQ
jgi:hypothetical protein